MATGLLLILASCSQPAPRPKSVCDLPSNVASWSGATVRWKGPVVGTFHHGFAMIAEDCQRRGISLDGWETAPGGEELDAALRQYISRPGLVRADVTGKILDNDDRHLWITHVHGIDFRPMTDAQEEAYWRSRVFSP